MNDRERFEKMQRDAAQAPAYVATIVIRVHHDGSRSMEAPMGDKQLCLQMLDEAREQVLANAKDAGWLFAPPGHSDAKVKPEGYT